ncbi:hypothetical protein K438DRAFT_1542157, partial [Mycena galopus ATCC 62051]
CRVGCDAIEDAHHIFVHCVRCTEWRTKAANELHQRAVGAVGLLFSDDSIWPLRYSIHYLGHVPGFDHLVPTINDPTPLSQSRLAHHFAADWHVASIRLAGRIWGDWQKTTAVAIDARGR